MTLLKGLSKSQKAAERYKQHPKIYCLEYAKSGRATCRACKKRVEEGQLRLGVDVSGNHWNDHEWYHWGCVKDGTLREMGGKQRLVKLERLQPEDRDAVDQRFKALS